MKNGLVKSAGIATLGLVGVITFAAFAQSVHFKGGKNAGPTTADNGLTLTSCGSLSGLGNGDVTINVSASGDTVTTCTNQGGTQAPGQNPAPVTTAGTVTIPASEIKNGNLSFCVTTQPPAQPTSAKAAGCANDNWTGEIIDVAFKNYTLTVVQGGKVVLTQSFTVK